ncbi:MAG TPA: sigma-70 family RNA polymerase sigma factor [Phycisphaerae bacterium]|nr:sigma-70 family RNA polymerase sigma factor [Phycisphaerae bacterium]
MLRLRDGDDGAFAELVQRNTPKVHGLVFRFLGDPQAVDDLTQEVFLRIYRTAGRYQPAAKFSTWMYRIVANLAFNVLRTRRKGHAVPLEVSDTRDGETFFADVRDDKTHAPHQRLADDELQAQVARAVAELPENQKIAIVLNKYEDKSYEDIAEVLDCTVMAVKSLLSRARENLRVSLEKYIEHK